MQTVIYLLLLQLLLFTAATSVVTLAFLIRNRPDAWVWYGLAKSGIAVTSLLLFSRVLPSPDHSVPLTWLVLAYMLSLVSICVGMIGVSVDLMRKSAHKRIDKEVNE